MSERRKTLKRMIAAGRVKGKKEPRILTTDEVIAVLDALDNAGVKLRNLLDRLEEPGMVYPQASIQNAISDIEGALRDARNAMEDDT